MATNEQRILAYIRANPGRGDEEIARALGITPTTQVNRLCNLLADEGLIRRYKAPVGGRRRLVNDPVAPPDRRP